jgi:hypothetical protein
MDDIYVLTAIVEAGVRADELTETDICGMLGTTPVRAFIDDLLCRLQDYGFSHELHTSSGAWATLLEDALDDIELRD